MNSSNHPAAYGYQPPTPYGFSPQKPRVPDVLLKELFVQIERKLFVLTLKQNDRGRFLRLTEEAHARQTTVIIPGTGLSELHQALGEMIKADAAAAPKPDLIS